VHGNLHCTPRSAHKKSAAPEAKERHPGLFDGTCTPPLLFSLESESAPSCGLLGSVPTMTTLRWAESRQWLGELERLANSRSARVFEPIASRASLAAWRLDGHPYAALAEEISRAICPS
jgi:hypothetical protein